MGSYYYVAASRLVLPPATEDAYSTAVAGIEGLVARWRLSDATDEVGSLNLTPVGSPTFGAADLPLGSTDGSMQLEQPVA